jgi:hypothetical protein
MIRREQKRSETSVKIGAKKKGKSRLTVDANLFRINFLHDKERTGRHLRHESLRVCLDFFQHLKHILQFALIIAV